MTLTHRHLDVPAGPSPVALPLDALDDLLDRGGFDDWAPLARAIARDPNGGLADRVAALCRAHEMYGTSALWLAFIERCRGSAGGAGESLADVRKRRAVTQREVAAALGISQSDVSKLERRSDVRISTLRQFVEALGGRLVISADFDDERAVLGDGAWRRG